MNDRLFFDITPAFGGYVSLAKTSRGLCSVMMQDNQADLLALIKRRFAGRDCTHSIAELAPAMRDFQCWLTQPAHRFTTPLDIESGTRFQREVWQALCQIPAGTTQTYSDVAEAIGQPRAVRAVASACGTNPVAIIVPCHRVIRRDGSLGGFYWGLDKKRLLLAHEQS